MCEVDIEVLEEYSSIYMFVSARVAYIVEKRENVHNAHVRLQPPLPPLIVPKYSHKIWKALKVYLMPVLG